MVAGYATNSIKSLHNETRAIAKCFRNRAEAYENLSIPTLILQKLFNTKVSPLTVCHAKRMAPPISGPPGPCTAATDGPPGPSLAPQTVPL